MVYRVYVEKKEALANEARALLEDLRAFLGIQSLTGLRLFNRYDLEGISRELFDYAVQTVLSEPQLDTVTSEVPQGDTVFAVEYLPGQYDQRADSAAQCIQLMTQEERPTVRTARIYLLFGPLTAAELSERCDEDKAAVSRTLEFLLQNGYVTTEAVSRRYRSPLYLTNRGREVFAALQARIASMEDAASMGLTEEQRSKMYAALELICGNLERLCAAEQEDTL